MNNPGTLRVPFRAIRVFLFLQAPYVLTASGLSWLCCLAKVMICPFPNSDGVYCIERGSSRTTSRSLTPSSPLNRALRLDSSSLYPRSWRRKQVMETDHRDSSQNISSLDSRFRICLLASSCARQSQTPKNLPARNSEIGCRIPIVRVRRTGIH